MEPGTDVEVYDPEQSEEEALVESESFLTGKRSQPPVPVPNGMRQVWHRQPNETWQAFEAFVSYLTLGDQRSLRQVAEGLGKSLTLIARWSRQWHWVYRVASYAEHYLLLELESVEADRDRMFVRHSSIAQTAHMLVEARMQDIQDKIADGKLNEDDLKTPELIRLLAEAAKIERIAILGRLEGAKEIAEREAKLEELYAADLSNKLQAILHECGVDPQRARDAIAKHLVGG